MGLSRSSSPVKQHRKVSRILAAQFPHHGGSSQHHKPKALRHSIFLIILILMPSIYIYCVLDQSSRRASEAAPKLAAADFGRSQGGNFGAEVSNAAPFGSTGGSSGTDDDDVGSKEDPSTSTYKWMLYYTIGGEDVQYIELLRLQLATLRAFPENDGIDVYILLDPHFVDAAEDIFPSDVSLVYHGMNMENCTRPSSECSAIFASMRKTKVFQLVPATSRYDAVLFLDSDVVITGSLQPIFTKIMEIKDKLHVKGDFGSSKRWAHNHYYWSNRDYAEEEWAALMDNNVTVFNAGQFGFCPTPAMKQHFVRLNAQIAEHGKNKHFYEQSHMNRYFNPRLLTVPTLDALVGGRDQALEFPVIHHKNAQLALSEKLEHMQRTWANVSSRYQFISHPSCYSMHKLMSASKIVAVGIDDIEFLAYLLERFNPKTLWVVDSATNKPLYNRLVKTSGKSRIADRRSSNSVRFVDLDASDSLNTRSFSGRRVDFVYQHFDETTSYKDARRAVKNAFDVLEPGGWLAGRGHYCSTKVMKALDWFCEMYGVRVWYIFHEEKDGDACATFAIKV